MNTIHAKLLGKIDIRLDGTNPVDIQGRKVQELLCYLLIYRNRPHLREKLAKALWEENSGEQSKSYLRRTLWQFQQQFERQGESYPHLLLMESDWIQLNPKASFWLDVDILESAYQQVKDLPGEELDPKRAQMLQEASKLYCGELLEGWYQPWCICERERINYIYLVILDKLMRYSEVQGNLEAGIAYGQRILSCDPAREYTHRQLMRLLYFARDRSGALHQYKRCVTALREELDVEPTRRTQMLYDQICQDKVSFSVSECLDSQFLGITDRALLHQLLVELEMIQLEIDCLNRRVVLTSGIVNGLLKSSYPETIAN